MCNSQILEKQLFHELNAKMYEKVVEKLFHEKPFIL